jgi:hypothetical protein
VKLREIVNPWGALKQARAEIQSYRLALGGTEKLQRAQAAMHRVDDKANALKIQNLKDEIRRLEQVIAGGHYRNPQTGRLGRKGERFDAGAKQQ